MQSHLRDMLCEKFAETKAIHASQAGEIEEIDETINIGFDALPMRYKHQLINATSEEGPVEKLSHICAKTSDMSMEPSDDALDKLEFLAQDLPPYYPTDLTPQMAQDVLNQP